MNKIAPILIIACLLIGCRPKMENSLDSTSIDQTDWIYHVDSLLMPFWMSSDALGNPPGNYPAYRYSNGSAIDPTNLDYTILVPEFQQFYMENTDSLRRDFIRVKSRQIYGYCVAFHLTGNEKYLKNAKLGLDFLIDNGAYKDGSIVSFWDNEGNPKPDINQRNSQDLAYGLLGPSIYYYLTRDPSILEIILETNRFYWNAYYEKAELKENTKFFAWVLRDFEGDSIQDNRLIAPLDQLNAYTLLTAQIVPDSLSAEYLDKVKILANSIKDNFYSEKYNIFWSRLNNKNFEGNTDFAHSIKTFWMLYVSAKTYGDKTMEDFAFQGAQRLLNSAYLKDEGRWASKYLDESLELDKSLAAWHCSELDQMAATLSFKDTTFYSKYLKQTFPYFEKNMIDPENKSTHWGRSAKGNIIDIGFRSGWHISNFHDMERALIGYLSTANYFGNDIELYFAFKKNITPENTIIKPYYYNADIIEINASEFNNPIFSDLIKSHVIFDKIN